MSSLPGIRTRSTLRLAGILALAVGAVVAAVAPGLFTLGAQLSSVIASVELTAGAALQAQNSWILPAAFTVTVFALVVGGSMALTRAPAARSVVPVRARNTDRPVPIEFELREPERALAVRLDKLPGTAD